MELMSPPGGGGTAVRETPTGLCAMGLNSDALTHSVPFGTQEIMGLQSLSSSPLPFLQKGHSISVQGNWKPPTVSP